MSTFKAVNIESDDESDDEIDNTKEIQVEDALKKYQSALKLHSQPGGLEEAGKEYESLFQSEIFDLPEAKSEYARGDNYDQTEDFDELDTAANGDDQEAAPNPPATDTGPGTLPQLLHLSYKNRGEYHLDRLSETLQQTQSVVEKAKEVRNAVTKALDDFGEALDKDEDDLDLWRRAARIGKTLGSQRIARFCLESAVEGDVEWREEMSGQPNLETSLNAHSLAQLHNHIQDDLSAIAGREMVRQLHKPSKLIESRLALYPRLPLTPPKTPEINGDTRSKRETIQLSEANWESLGECLCNRLKAEQNGAVEPKPGYSVAFDLPAGSGSGDTQHNENDNIITESPVNETFSSRRSQSVDPNRQKNPSDPTTIETPVKSGPGPRTSLPSRKRSSDTAEIQENTPEVERHRSKRIRARESIGGKRGGTEETVRDDAFQTSGGETPKLIIKADGWLHSVTEPIVKKMGIYNLAHPQDIRKLVISDTSIEDDAIRSSFVIRELYRSMQSWTDEKTAILTRKEDNTGHDTSSSGPNRSPGLSAFLDYSNSSTTKTTASTLTQQLNEFVQHVNDGWYQISEVAILYLTFLTCGDRLSSSDLIIPSFRYSLYTQTQWTERLKQTVQLLLLLTDSDLFTFVQAQCLQAFEEPSHSPDSSTLAHCLCEHIQTIFEMYLDTFSQMAPDASQPVTGNKETSRQSLTRWSRLARDTVCYLAENYGNFNAGDNMKQAIENLVIRHLWSTVFSLKALDEISREYLILCVQDLKAWLMVHDSTRQLQLPNSSTMPEISIPAADRELSKLETMDFFLGIFAEQHPVDLIERLEPILISWHIGEDTDPEAPSSPIQTRRRTRKSKSPYPEGAMTDISKDEPVDANRKVLMDFVAKTDLSLRVMLWELLRQAYEKIDYAPMALNINMHMIQAIVDDLCSSAFRNMPAENRKQTMLRSFRKLNELLTACLSLIEQDPDHVFDCMESPLLRTSTSTLLELWNMLYSMFLFDDYTSIAHKAPLMPNPFRAYPTESFHNASIIFHCMQVRTSILIYKMFCEAMNQNPQKFQAWAADRVDYLRYVHYSLGMRRLCKSGDNMFLHFMRKECAREELCKLTSDDIAQIVYDLYDLQCFSTIQQRQDHGCDADYLDPQTASELVDFVLEKANKTITKDIPKSDLGRTIEKVHGALGPLQSAGVIIRNRKILQAFVKSPINPLDLFQCLKGIGYVSTAPVTPNEAPLAEKGWFYLMGQISLTKQRAQRSKGNPASAEDQQTSVTFFNHDLEYNSEHWETWTRLGQSHDYAIEEQVLWSTEKLNSNSEELMKSQRSAIHAYSMACATSLRTAEPSMINVQKKSDMYFDFASRIYAASRPPFSMSAFTTDDVPEKFFSGQAGQPGGTGLFRKTAFSSLNKYQAWKLTTTLIRRAIFLRDDHWQSHLLLAKAMWKLIQASVGEENFTNALNKLVEVMLKAVTTCPPRKDMSKSDPILEPLYKSIAIIDKFVLRKLVSIGEGASMVITILEAQKQIDIQEMPSLSNEQENWDRFTLKVFTLMRSADKAKWYHRIVHKIAVIMYRKDDRSATAAKSAKEWLADQHIYSQKTLALQVWKPENERAGRHWVYLTEYSKLLCELFVKTKDLEGMQLLLRRVRKKPNEYFEHSALWERLCSAHLSLFRAHAQIPVRVDDVVFKSMSVEEFGKKAIEVDEWCSAPERDHPYIHVLREAVELKKLNQNLIKATGMDDLIADSYAMIWSHFFQEIKKAGGEEGEDKSQSNAGTAHSLESAPQRLNVMALNNLMNLDGTVSRDSTPFGGTHQTMNSNGMENTQARPPRSRTVSKREIVKHAVDAAQIKITAVQNSKTNGSDQLPEVKVVIQVARSSKQNGGDGDATGNDDDRQNDGTNDEDEERMDDKAGAGLDSSDLSDFDGDIGPDPEAEDAGVGDEEEDEEEDEEAGEDGDDEGDGEDDDGGASGDEGQEDASELPTTFKAQSSAHDTLQSHDQGQQDGQNGDVKMEG